jgi:hypothetical protein
VIAHRLGNAAFQEWVDHELNGYGDAKLPPYRRKIKGHLFAYLSGPFQSAIKNVQVPESLLGKYADDWVDFDFSEGASYLEALLESARVSEKNLQRFLPPEIFAQLEIVDGYSTMSMWSSLTAASLEGVLDQIRNRALGFLLDLESIDPTAGDFGESPPKQREVDDLFRRHFYGR